MHAVMATFKKVLNLKLSEVFQSSLTFMMLMMMMVVTTTGKMTMTAMITITAPMTTTMMIAMIRVA